MLTKVFTCAMVGLEGRVVEVEVDISPDLPAFTIAVMHNQAGLLGRNDHKECQAN